MTVRRLLQNKAGHWLLTRQEAELTEVTMPGKRYKVTLEPDERGELEKLISRGKGAARRLAHARILLHADQGEGRPGKIDAEIAEAVGGERGDHRAGSPALCRRGAGGGFKPASAAPALSAQTGR